MNDVDDADGEIEIHKEVTGGALYGLWRNANIVLPSIESVYNDQMPESRVMSQMEGPLGLFDGCGEAMFANMTYLESILYSTSRSLSLAARALQSAIDEYSYVDGDTAGHLNKAGKQLNGILKEQKADPFKPTPVPEGYTGPV